MRCTHTDGPDSGALLMSQLTVDDNGDVHEVDLAACLDAGLAAVQALVGVGHLMDLEVVIGQHLEPPFNRGGEREGKRSKKGSAIFPAYILMIFSEI